MSKRETTRKVRSSEVQGSGSFVVFKKIRVKDMREIQESYANIEEDDSEASMKLTTDLLKDYLIEWNWCDENQEPLPLPAEDPDVIENLTDEELLFLSENITGSKNRKK